MIASFPSSHEILLMVGFFLAGYLVGSIPEAWLLAYLIKRRDLRLMGSGNVGVMNTALSVTRWAGLLVFLSEIAKGLLAVTIPRRLGVSDSVICLAVLGTVAGVRWPVYLRFQGGRGNTTGFAALFIISYPSLVILLSVWILARIGLKNSFISTRVTILSLPVILAMVTRSWLFAATALILSLIYLGAQQVKSDDHLAIKLQWKSFWGFLISPPRTR